MRIIKATKGRKENLGQWIVTVAISKEELEGLAQPIEVEYNKMDLKTLYNKQAAIQAAIEKHAFREA